MIRFKNTCLFLGLAGVTLTSDMALSASGAIEEVIVTATRRAENLQDVPIAISAFSGAELADSGIQSIVDLQTQTPSLTVTRQAQGINIFIRGIGAADASVGGEAAVATYVDGVYLSSAYGSLFSFSNIERIEVLKGPQGTLFGRNATGGLVHVITKDPDSEPALSGSVSYGNYDTVEGKLYGSMPLTENLAANAAFIYRNQGEGWGDNLDTGKEVGFEGDYWGMRGKFLYTPSDHTRITLGYDYFKNEDGDTGIARNVSQGTVTTVDGRGFNGDFYDSVGNVQPVWNIELWGGSLTVEHEFDAFDFKSITAYREQENDQQFDNDLTAGVLFDVHIDKHTVQTFTQEFQLSSNSDSDLSWIVGAFYLDDDAGQEDPHGTAIIGSGLPTGGIKLRNRINTESQSVFGELTYALTERTDLTVGIRYTDDEREQSGKTEVLGGSSLDSPVIATVSINPKRNFDEDNFTWRLVLEHSFSDDFMGYASYNRGFKSGNFTVSSGTAPPYDSEEVDAYEIGFKSEFADGRLQLNASTFFYDYTNLQVPNIQGGFLVTSNAAEAEIYGLDFEGQFLATDQLRFRFGASILDTEYTSYPGAPCVGFDANGMISEFFCDVTGNKLVRAAELEYNLAVYYTIPTDSGSYHLNLAYSYNDGYPFTVDNNSVAEQGSYSILNGQVKWMSPDSKFGLGIFGKNLLDEEYLGYVQETSWGATDTMQPPRTYGVEFSFAL